LSRLLLIALILGLAGGAGAEEILDRMVAVVEEEPIFMSDVEAALAEELYLRSMQGEPMPADSAELEALRQRLLDDIIERRIVIAKAREKGLEASRTEVEDALDSWMSEMIESVGSEAAFLAELERQGMDLKSFKARYRQDIREQLLVTEFMRAEFGALGVSEEEIAEFFDTRYDSIPEIPEVVGISHIMIVPQVSAEREDRAIARVERAVARLESGDTFEEVAADISEDPLTRNKGGMIGRVRLDDLAPAMASIASGLEAGQVSEPVRTDYGFEIVKVDEKYDDIYNLRHIQIRLSPTRQDTADAAMLASEIRERIAAGESFESLARRHSDDEATREAGGFVGEAEISAFDRVYRETLRDLDPGEVSPVIRTQHGFQIIKLVSRKAGRKPSLDEARDMIRNLIESRKREQRFSAWLDEAREEVYIERF
jgi:peptidyl-prolyl cis-trans isomerase SurA